MRIGVFISETWGDPSPIDEVRLRARQVEAAGLAAGWVPYLPWALDSLAAVQAAGEVTERIELGSAVIPTYLFHPLAMARQAATVQAAVGREITLGIGCSNAAVIQMHGLAYERPAQHVREYLEVLHRAAESEGQVAYEGDIFRPQGLYSTPGTGLGPILVGALGPLMLRVAGELSDGTIATWCNARALEDVIGPGIRQAAKAAGRPEPRVGGVVPVAVTHDAASVRDQAREHFGVYEGLPRYKRMLALGGVESAADVCVIGDEAEVRQRLQGFAGAGMTDFLAAPYSIGPNRQADWQRTVDCLGSLAEGLRR
jgi:F420-dependent oxidoreductase-like protein